MRTGLSEAELTVLRLAARGMGLGDIAKEIGLSYEATRGHMYRMRKRLAAKTTAHAVAIGYERCYLKRGLR